MSANKMAKVDQYFSPYMPAPALEMIMEEFVDPPRSRFRRESGPSIGHRSNSISTIRLSTLAIVTTPISKR